MKIKQLFCKHIWALEKEEFSYSLVYKHLYMMTSNGVKHKKENVYILYFKCVKCDRKKIQEQATNVTV